MQSIFKFTTSLILCLVVITTHAQNKNKDAIVEKTKWWSGVTLQVDAASLISSAISNGETYSMEAGAQLGIKNKYYPILEIGIAGADKTTAQDINFKTNGLFGRVGVDINLKKSKPEAKPSNNLFTAGLRLGMSSFAYYTNNIVITDEYWGNKEVLNFNNQITSKFWYEIVVGMRVEVFKNTYMGWQVRNKHIINKDAASEIFPWYIPGYGLNNTSIWGVNYILGYKF